mmetsp:Transcript_19348/g.57695  ORF Transcript_19348/g.57695 Transcript_19348/m.57695 type:complete len:211 (+) Transcript_19348:150-782(+)
MPTSNWAYRSPRGARCCRCPHSRSRLHHLLRRAHRHGLPTVAAGTLPRVVERCCHGGRFHACGRCGFPVPVSGGLGSDGQHCRPVGAFHGCVDVRPLRGVGRSSTSGLRGRIGRWDHGADIGCARRELVGWLRHLRRHRCCGRDCLCDVRARKATGLHRCRSTPAAATCLCPLCPVDSVRSFHRSRIDHIRAHGGASTRYHRVQFSVALR